MPSIVGVRVWFDDGSVIAWPPGNLRNKWETARGNGVQFVRIYFADTYQIWRDGVWVTENYCADFHTHRGGRVSLGGGIRRDVSTDYFWYNPTTQEFGADSFENVPTALSAGAIKTGSDLPDAQFWAIYNVAKDMRTAP